MTDRRAAHGDRGEEGSLLASVEERSLPASVEQWRARAAGVRAEYWRGTAKSGTGAADNPMAELAPEFAQLIADLSFGETYANPTLDLKTRALCTVSALVARGEEAYAANWIGNALRAGATPDEVVELLRQLFFYLGSTLTVKGFAAAKAAFTGLGGAEQTQSQTGADKEGLEGT